MLTRRNILGAVSAAAILRPFAAAAEIDCGAPVSTGILPCQVGVPIGEIETARQRCDEWCWAACIQTVFELHGRNIDQETAVIKIFGSLVCQPATPEQIVQAINGTWNDNSGTTFNAIADRLPNASLHDYSYQVSQCTSDSFHCLIDTPQGDLDKRVVTELQNGNPLIVGALGHATVLTAISYFDFQADKSAALRELVVRDPWPGNPNRRALTAQEVQDSFFVVKVSVI